MTMISQKRSLKNAGNQNLTLQNKSSQNWKNQDHSTVEEKANSNGGKSIALDERVHTDAKATKDIVDAKTTRDIMIKDIVDAKTMTDIVSKDCHLKDQGKIDDKDQCHPCLKVPKTTTDIVSRKSTTKDNSHQCLGAEDNKDITSRKSTAKDQCHPCLTDTMTRAMFQNGLVEIKKENLDNKQI